MDAKTARMIKEKAIREKIELGSKIQAEIRERTADLLADDVNRIYKEIADMAGIGHMEARYTVVLSDMARTYKPEMLKLAFKPYLEQVFKADGYKVRVDAKDSGSHGILVVVRW